MFDDRGRDGDEGLLAFGVRQDSYIFDIIIVIIAYILVPLFAIFRFGQESVHDLTNAVYFISCLVSVLAFGIVGLFFFTYRLQRTVERANSEYRTLCQALASELNQSILEVVKRQVESLEPMHRNDRIRLENALEYMTRAFARESLPKAFLD